MNVIDLLKREQEKPKVPVLRSGDTVRVHVKVVEGARERIQVFEGIIIALQKQASLSSSFTVRRISHGVGVERTFLIHSPRIDKIEVLRYGDVRRAKLYYLRDKVGKSARISERRQPIGGPETTRVSSAAAAAAAEQKPAVESGKPVEEAPEEPSSLVDAIDNDVETRPKEDGQPEVVADVGNSEPAIAAGDQAQK